MRAFFSSYFSLTDAARMNGITHRHAPNRCFSAAAPARHATIRICSLSVCLLVLLNGCSLAGRRTSVEAPVVAPAGSSVEPQATGTIQPMAEAPAATPAAKESILLTYRTDSGRLNQSAAEENSNAKPVPAFTTSTLQIQYPHPQDINGYARVTATFESRTDDDTDGSLWSIIKGKDSESKPTPPQFHEAWIADIRDWQLASLIADLKKKDFFRRVKVLDSDSHIRVEINGSTVSKEFPPIAELDRLLITIRQEGRPASEPAGAALP